MIVLSPHLDDAVLSLAEWMLGCGCDVTVATVFSEGDQARKAEDEAALAMLGVESRHLGLRDEPGRTYVDPLSVRADIGALMGREPVLAPLGIHHPDHRVVSWVAAKWFGQHVAGFYEELPYRVMFPDDRAARIGAVRLDFDLQVDSCGGFLAAKRAAVACYASQLGEDVQRCAFAPERIWWVRR